jgi:GTP-binding protein
MPSAAAIEGLRPLVVIVGAPNVGKSNLFNRLIGARKAIVTDRPGITRDRIYGTVAVGDGVFALCDTGGLMPGDSDRMSTFVRKQTEEAIEQADLLVFVVDGRNGLTPLEEELAGLLRSRGKPVITAVNKIDNPVEEFRGAEYHRLGCGEPITMSAEQGIGTTDLLEAIERVLSPLPAASRTDDPEIKVAVVGKPNAGKSSLLNRLVGSERHTVSEIPGTTRDAIDTLIVHGDHRYRFIDTAGLRRRGKTADLAEVLSSAVARKTIQRADVVLMLLDASQPISALDQTIAGYVSDARRPIILVANKWDLVEDPEEATKKLRAEMGRQFQFVRYAPVITVSALTGLRVEKLFAQIDQVQRSAATRLPTAELNRFMRAEVVSGRGPNLLYITQTGVLPPSFVVFTHDPAKVHFSLKRQVENRLREKFDFGPTPIILKFKSTTRKKEQP